MKLRINASARTYYCRDVEVDDDMRAMLAHNIVGGCNNMECDDFFLRPNHDVSNEEIDSDEVEIYVQDGTKPDGKPKWKEIDEKTLKEWAKKYDE